MRGPKSKAQRESKRQGRRSSDAAATRIPRAGGPPAQRQALAFMGASHHKASGRETIPLPCPEASSAEEGG